MPINYYRLFLDYRIYLVHAHCAAGACMAWSDGTRTHAQLHERALCTRTARARTYSVPGTRPSGFDLEPAERVPLVKQGARSSCLLFLDA